MAAECEHEGGQEGEGVEKRYGRSISQCLTIGRNTVPTPKPAGAPHCPGRREIGAVYRAGVGRLWGGGGIMLWARPPLSEDPCP